MLAKRAKMEEPSSSEHEASTLIIHERLPDRPGRRVTGLQLLDDGPTFEFAELAHSTAPLQSIVIGRAINCDIVLRDRTVTKVHCQVQWSDTSTWVRDYESSNGTLVNGVPISDGRTELLPGFVLDIGGCSLMVCGEAPTYPLIVAQDKHAFVRKADYYYSSPRKAAIGTQFSRSTLVRWLKKSQRKKPR